MLHAIPDAFMLLDADWRFQFLNQQAEKLLARPAAELLGRVVWDEFPEAVGSQFQGQYELAVREQRPVTFTEYYAPLERWFSVSAQPRPEGLWIYFRDVNELKLAQEQAAQLSAVHAGLRRVATAVAAEAEPARIQQLVCEQAVELLHADGAWIERLEGDGAEVVAEAGLPAAELRDTIAAPVPAGAGVWGTITVGWGEESPEPRGLCPVLADLADLVALALVNAQVRFDRREYESHLEAARDYMLAVTAGIAEGLIAVDEQRVVIYANAATGDLLGRDATALVGMGLDDVLGREDGDGPVPAAEREVVRAEHDVFARADGRRITVEWTAAPLFAGAGGGHVLIFRENSARIEREEQLIREAEGLRSAARIRDALDSDRFVLYAQPIVNLSTGAVQAHELLIRLREEDGSVVPPGDFLPAAEEHGLMEQIDRWVVGRAVQVAAAGEPVHLNISSRSMDDPVILASLDHALRKSGAHPQDVTVEITETALIANLRAARDFARHVHALGCKIALDDFGTGYNSFSRLKDLPIDELKIDGEFVRDISASHASQGVVRAVVSLAGALGLVTVAEGVEDEATLALLAQLGVGCGQGYHIGRPAPVRQV